VRSVRAADFKRRVYLRKYAFTIDAFTFENVIGLGTGTIEFRGGLTIIAGGNGTGKTTLYDAMLSVLCNGTVPPVTVNRRLARARVEARVTSEDGAAAVFVDRRDCGMNLTLLNLPVYAIAPAVAAREAIRFFAEMDNLQELLEAHSPRELTKDEVEAISYLVGKNYSAISVFELDEFENESQRLYFSVSCDGVTYGSEMMGVGELALHLLWFNLTFVVQKNSALLLDEPEIALAPRSQVALLDVLAQTSVRRGVWTIVISHSPHIIYGVPNDHVRLLSRNGASVEVVSRPSPSQLDQLLGWPPELTTTMMCEDRLSRLFLSACLRRLMPDVAYTSTVTDIGNAESLAAVVGTIPRLNRGGRRYVGIFDGDQRARTFSTDVQRAVVFLPTAAAPEEFLIGCVNTQTVATIAQDLHVDEARVRFAISELGGVDHHDWLEELSKRLSVNYEQVVEALTAVWISNAGPDVEALCEALIGALREDQ